MRVKRNRQVDSERQAVNDAVARMEAVRRAATMKAERQAAAVELAFQISYWLQIDFRLISDW